MEKRKSRPWHPVRYAPQSNHQPKEDIGNLCELPLEDKTRGVVSFSKAAFLNLRAFRSIGVYPYLFLDKRRVTGIATV